MVGRRDDNQGTKLSVLAAVVAVVAILYFAQEVLLPIALATLLSFVLSPLVLRLERARLGRVPAVVLTVALAFAVIGGIGWVVTTQLYDLATDLPKYQDTLVRKIEGVRGAFGGPSPVTESLQEIQKELTKTPGEQDAAGEQDATTEGAPDSPVAAEVDQAADQVARQAEQLEDPVPVRIVEAVPVPVQLMRDWLGPLLSPLGTAAIVIVFVIFMLIQREDLRDRLIRLAGTGRVYVTTHALDEAAARVSRYLLMQLIINATYGVAVAIGLFFIGIPNALLWGLLSAVVRYVPYVGPWIGALLPITLSIVAFEGWTRPLLTVGLFVALELFSNNVMEPWLYGRRTGISVVGIIVAAVFWTWLWGPIGLVLATPLTVCLTVLGRHVPALNFLNVLLSDEPALELHVRFYQRLLAFDEHEANDLVGDFLKTGSLDELYEQLLIPALSFSERDRHAGYQSENQQRFIHRFVGALIDSLGEEYQMTSATEAVPEGAAEEEAAEHAEAPQRRSLRILCVPAEDRADRLAGRMLVQLLAARGHFAEAVEPNAVNPRIPDLVAERQSDAVVISALAPGGAIQSRDGCRQLRPRVRQLKILVGLWNAQGPMERTREQMRAAGADFTTISLSEGLDRISKLAEEAAPEREGRADREPVVAGAARRPR